MRKVRSITPNDPADFTPELENYKTLQPFRYWCQKVLPLVYDDSLSYYELLCKVVDYLNKTMEDVEMLHGDVTNLHAAYEELQSYVNEYFSTLDVQKEINNKLDELFNSGKFNELFAKYIPYGTPQMYGAKGDGISDDTNAFKECLEKNKCVIIPKGNYLITESIDCNATIIKCFGKIIFKPNGLKRYFLLFSNINSLSINGINFDGNNMCGQCIWVVNSLKGTNLTINNCVIKNLRNLDTTFEPSGIYIFQAFDSILIENNYIYNVKKVESGVGLTSATGITVNETMGNVIIRNNYIDTITTEYNDENNVFDCDGIRVGGNGKILITENTIMNCMGRGIKIQAPYTDVISNIIKVQDIVTAYNYAGIETQFANGVISGNIIELNVSIPKNICHIRISAYESHTFDTLCVVENNNMKSNINTIVCPIQLIKDVVTTGELAYKILNNLCTETRFFIQVRLSNISNLINLDVSNNNCFTSSALIYFIDSDIITDNDDTGNSIRELFKLTSINNKNSYNNNVNTLYPITTAFYPYMFYLDNHDYLNTINGKGWTANELGSTKCYYNTDGSGGGIIGLDSPYNRYVYITPLYRLKSSNSSVLMLASSSNDAVVVKGFS